MTPAQKKKIATLNARHSKLRTLMVKYKKKLHGAKTEKKKASAKRKIHRLEGRITKLLRKTKNYMTKVANGKMKQRRPKKQKSATAPRKKVTVVKKSTAPHKSAKSEKQAKVQLTDAQIVAGAKMLTCSNLGSLASDPKNIEQLNTAWRICKANHEVEGIDIRSEYDEWEQLLRKGDAFAVGEVTTRLPWLF